MTKESLIQNIQWLLDDYSKTHASANDVVVGIRRHLVTYDDSQKSSVLITKRSEVADISNPCRECGNEVEDPDNFTICMMCYNLEMSE